MIKVGMGCNHGYNTTHPFLTHSASNTFLIAALEYKLKQRVHFRL